MAFLKKLLFNKKYTATEIEHLSFLASNELFTHLTRPEMLLFLPHLYLRTYQQNEVVFFRNDPSRALYLIKKGTIALSLDMQKNFEVFTYLNPTESLGSSALLNETQRAYNAIVFSEYCELYAIPQVNIFDIFNQNPLIKAKMLESLASIYNANTNLMLKNYRLTQGFFDIKDMFKDWKYGE